MPQLFKLTPLTSSIVDLSGSISLLLMMGAHSFECFIYFRMDRNLNKIVTDMLVRFKVKDTRSNFIINYFRL